MRTVKPAILPDLTCNHVSYLHDRRIKTVIGPRA